MAHNFKDKNIGVGITGSYCTYKKVFEELKSTFGPSVCPIVVPYVEDQQVKCYINLIDMISYT